MSNRFWGAKLLPSAFLALSLAACQSESPVLETSADNMSEITLSGTISKGELNTRTNLGLDDNEQKLIMTWNMGEYIHVSYTDGTYLGHLEVTGFADEAHALANFEGKIKAIPTNGDHNVYFYTLGHAHQYNGGSGKMTDMSYELENQISTNANALAANDLMLTPGVIHVIGGKATFENLRLKRQFAFGRFTLLYDGEPLTFDADGAVITIDTEAGDIKTGATIAFPENITASRGEQAIKLKATQNDFYVTFVPGSAEGKIKFNVTVNGEEYEGYTYRTHLIDKNKFFRKNEGGAYPINVKHTDGSDDQKTFVIHYDQNYRGTEDVVKNSEQTTDAKSYEFTISSYDALQFGQTREGYDFTGWNTEENGTGTNYAVGSKITLTYDATLTDKGMEKTLYAQWEKSTIDYKVTLKYDDGQTKEIPNPSKEDEVTVGLPGNGNSNPTKDGYEFLGWKEEGTDGPVSKDSWTLAKDKPQVVLVPAWKKNDSGFITPDAPGHGY